MDKLQELILYIAEKSKNDPRFGATKLNKILFIADFFAYANWAKSITETSYKKWTYGPIPNDLLAAKTSLFEGGRAHEEEKTYFGRPQKRIVPDDSAKLELFSEQELNLVNDVLETCLLYSGTHLSDWTHTLNNWLDAEEGEEIPYYTVFLMNEWPIGFEDIKWGEEKLKGIIEENYATRNLQLATV